MLAAELLFERGKQTHVDPRDNRVCGGSVSSDHSLNSPATVQYHPGSQIQIQVQVQVQIAAPESQVRVAGVAPEGGEPSPADLPTRCRV